MRFAQKGYDSRMFRNLNISKVGEGLQLLLGLWSVLGICSLSVLGLC